MFYTAKFNLIFNNLHIVTAIKRATHKNETSATKLCYQLKLKKTTFCGTLPHCRK